MGFSVTLTGSTGASVRVGSGSLSETRSVLVVLVGSGFSADISLTSKSIAARLYEHVEVKQRIEL